jgi:hypothetical protein
MVENKCNRQAAASFNNNDDSSYRKMQEIQKMNKSADKANKDAAAANRKTVPEPVGYDFSGWYAEVGKTGDWSAFDEVFQPNNE